MINVRELYKIDCSEKTKAFLSKYIQYLAIIGPHNCLIYTFPVKTPSNIKYLIWYIEYGPDAIDESKQKLICKPPCYFTGCVNPKHLTLSAIS